MTNRDEVTELADRLQARQQRGESWDLEFEVEFGGLTDEQRDEFMALMHERIAHRKERKEALEAQNRALKALLRLQVQRAPGMAVREAIGGHISLLEVVNAIDGAVPDPLAE